MKETFAIFWHFCGSLL